MQVINSLVFVLITHPFDIGDVVAVEEVLPGEFLKVCNIDVLTTTFEIVTSSKLVLVPNTRLNSACVENWSRNPSRQGGEGGAGEQPMPKAFVRMNFAVHLGTTKRQLDALQALLEAYVKEQELHWKEGIILRVVTADAAGLHLAAFAFSNYLWSDMGLDRSANIFKEKFSLYVKLLESLQKLNMVFRLPEQEISVALKDARALP